MFLGIDIGTSAVKASLVDSDLQLVDSADAAMRNSHPHSGWSEQHPDLWRAATITAVRDLISRHDAAQVRAIGLSGQMHGAVLMDAGQSVLRPAILWNDGRAAAECGALERDHPDLAHVAGVRPMPGLTGPKLPWLARHEPEIYGRIAHICLPKDHLGLWLHGALATDASDAAGTWWLDQKTHDWSPELCKATQTNPDWLPPVLHGTDIAGRLRPEAAEALGLPAGIPVSAGAGDAAAGAVSLGAVADGTAFISLGTSGQFFVPTTRYSAAPEVGLHSFAHTLPDLWFQMAAMLNGARPMSWFADVANRPIPELLAMAADAPGQTPLFLPYLTGERSPHGDAAIRGAFYGLENDTGPGEMMRAVIHAIAYSLCDAADSVRQTTTVPEPLLTIGGGTRSDLALQTIADATGLTLARGTGADVGPAVGAARMAAVACGAATVADLAQRPEIDREFVPNPEHMAFHAERLSRYRALYEALKPMRPGQN